MQAGHAFRQADVDLLVIYLTTYALSATVLPVVQRVGVPVLLLNLAPDAAIDYARFNQLGDRTQMNRRMAGVLFRLSRCRRWPTCFRRAGISFREVTGMLHNDPDGWHEIDEWLEAAHVKNVMAHNCLGLMGNNYYGGMLDIYTDPTLQLITFGGQMKLIEVDELSAGREACSRNRHPGARIALFYD